jgi:hypothetical protein
MGSAGKVFEIKRKAHNGVLGPFQMSIKRGYCFSKSQQVKWLSIPCLAKHGKGIDLIDAFFIS